MDRSPESSASSVVTPSAPGGPRPQPQSAGGEEAAKRARACDACRTAKVRCMPAPRDSSGPGCIRCVKSGKVCITSLPVGPRKKRKKAVNRVLELEKRIDLLTASLSARGSGPLLMEEQQSGRPGAPTRSPDPDHDEDQEGMEDEDDGDDTVIAEGESSPSIPPSLLHPQPGPASKGDVDFNIVRRGLISPADADTLFARYKEQMVHHSPIVVFPSDLSANELLKTRPVVFLAIMAAAAYDRPAQQRALVCELRRAFAEKIVVAAEKSLELVQALQISISWSWLPDTYEELPYYQQVSMSTAMAVDLGLGRRLPEKRASPYGRYAFRRRDDSQNTATIDPTSLEARRAWLGCYYLSSTMSVIMRRPLLLPWTRFMTESYEILRASPERAPTDEFLCATVWAYRLSEDAAQQVAVDDLEDPASATRLAFSLRKLERDLSLYRESLPRELLEETLTIGIGVVPLHLYGAVLHCDFVDGKPRERRPSNPSPLATSATRTMMLPDAVTLTAADIRTMSSCLLNVRLVTEAFLAMDAEKMRALPGFNFSRAVIAAAMLFKVYIFVDQDPDLAASIDKEQLGVEACIGKLIRKFHTAAADRCCRPAAKLIKVLFVIEDSFRAYCAHRMLEHGPPSKAFDSTFTQQQQQRINFPEERHQSPLQTAPQPPNAMRPTMPPMVTAPGQQFSNELLGQSWDFDFFAALSVEEFAYSMENNQNGMYYGDQYAITGDPGSSDVMMAQGNDQGQGQELGGNLGTASMLTNCGTADNAPWSGQSQFC